jgi:exodeoxyribonuclease VII large subunit
MRIDMADQFFDSDDRPDDGRDDTPAAGGNVIEFSVSDISQAIKRTLEGAFGRVRVRGEVGRPNYHGSGHLYFTLKDADAAMDAVAWRGTVGKLTLRLEEGMEVICTGRVSSYPKSSRYQIVVESVELAGEGALLKLLEDRRRKLAAEGLFEADRKRPLPFLPEVIGVVTSPTGAVIRDILHRLADRFPRHVLLWPVPVQGDGAAEKIAAAIRGFNALEAGGPVPRPDLLIVARGGGSLEDLWQFNEEVVVRAAAESGIPLISAVGHETDTTLIDYASDRRAPTPTAAAEMAVPVRSELMAQVLDDERRLVAATGRLMEERRNRIQGLARGLPRPAELLEGAAQSLDYATDGLRRNMADWIGDASIRVERLANRLPHPREQLEKAATGLAHAEGRLAGGLRSLVRERARGFEVLSPAARMQGGMERTLATAGARLKSAGQLLESLSYQRVLDRGFALVRDADGEPLLAAAATAPGQAVSIHFADGDVGAVISGDGAPPAAKAKPAPKAKATPKSDSKASSRPAPKPEGGPGGGQGTLF